MSFVSLQFPSLVYLCAFRRYSTATCWQIDINTLQVNCHCSDREAQVACQDFQALLLTGNTTAAVCQEGRPAAGLSLLRRIDLRKYIPRFLPFSWRLR
jgi:hypothetical protein